MLARGTPLWLGSLPIASILCGAFYLLIYRSGFLIYLGFILLLIGMVLVLFFRDPERTVGEGVVSPADGRILRVEEKGRGWWFVSIFMNIQDVHVNRSPWSGKVIDLTHHSGGFVPAFNKGSDRNERVVIRLRTDNGIWEITQIAGAVARRIIPYLFPGQELKKGERIGLIRFGSRVDMLFRMPAGMRIIVEPGQKVIAGRTGIAVPYRKIPGKGGRG
ncbi:MAG: phosphatidylserine decarboxylase [Candidatus Thermoplasmatota archaeon]|nr:phosphatidylserine decarboxylase [Candidatus Thermoplasmatota archaeon]